MVTLIDFFKHDHERCDALWVAVEEADEGSLRQALGAFVAAMEHHLDMEERLLFPAFEEATGMHSGGPTFVMRHEHDQMRGLLRRMEAAAGESDLDTVLGQGDTLLMIIQQHNVKEEQMLYPMAQRALGDQWAELHKLLAS